MDRSRDQAFCAAPERVGALGGRIADRIRPPADARGRASFEDRDYPQAEYFLNALKAANEVNGKSLQEQGFENKALGQEIKRRRIEYIKNVGENNY